MTQKHKYLVPFSFLADEGSVLDWPFTSKNSGCTPLSLWEDEETVTVEAVAPGIHPEDIRVHHEKGVLTIQGSKKDTEEDTKKKYLRKMNQSFAYQLDIPAEVEPDSETAELKDGILKITFKKSKREMPKRIPVKHT